MKQRFQSLGLNAKTPDHLSPLKAARRRSRVSDDLNYSPQNAVPGACRRWAAEYGSVLRRRGRGYRSDCRCRPAGKPRLRSPPNIQAAIKGQIATAGAAALVGPGHLEATDHTDRDRRSRRCGAVLRFSETAGLRRLSDRYPRPRRRLATDGPVDPASRPYNPSSRLIARIRLRSGEERGRRLNTLSDRGIPREGRHGRGVPRRGSPA